MPPQTRSDPAAVPQHGPEERRTPLERADTQNAGLIRPALSGRGVSSSPPRRRPRRAGPGRPRSSGPSSTGSPPAAPPTPSPAPARPSRPWSARPARSTSSSTARAASARCCSGRGWSAPPAASSSASPSCAAAATIGVAAAALALGAFAVLACAGLAIIPRYTMLAAAILGVFAAARPCSAGGCSSAAIPGAAPGRPSPRVVALMFVVWAPNQYDLLHRVDVDLTNQSEIEADLNDLADSGAFEPLCCPISVPNHRAVPRLAFDLDLQPERDRQLQRAAPAPARLLPRPGQPLRRSTTSSSTPTTRPASRPPSPPASAAVAATSPGSSTAAARCARTCRQACAAMFSGGVQAIRPVRADRRLRRRRARGRDRADDRARPEQPEDDLRADLRRARGLHGRSSSPCSAPTWSGSPAASARGSRTRRRRRRRGRSRTRRRWRSRELWAALAVKPIDRRGGQSPRPGLGRRPAQPAPRHDRDAADLPHRPARSTSSKASCRC